VTSYRGSTVNCSVLQSLGSNPVTTLDTEEINKELSSEGLEIYSKAAGNGAKKGDCKLQLTKSLTACLQKSDAFSILSITSEVGFSTVRA
jgi:hypothetical protein